MQTGGMRCGLAFAALPWATSGWGRRLWQAARRGAPPVERNVKWSPQWQGSQGQRGEGQSAGGAVDWVRVSLKPGGKSALREFCESQPILCRARQLQGGVAADVLDGTRAAHLVSRLLDEWVLAAVVDKKFGHTYCESRTRLRAPGHRVDGDWGECASAGEQVAELALARGIAQARRDFGKERWDSPPLQALVRGAEGRGLLVLPSLPAARQRPRKR